MSNEGDSVFSPQEEESTSNPDVGQSNEGDSVFSPQEEEIVSNPNVEQDQPILSNEVAEIPQADIVDGPPPIESSSSDTTDGTHTSERTETAEGAQTFIVTRLIKVKVEKATRQFYKYRNTFGYGMPNQVEFLKQTISRLRTENAFLEIRISDSEKHNKLLQLQIDIMVKKMDALEGFMSKVNQMNEQNGDGTPEQPEQSSLCKACKRNLNQLEELPDLSDTDDVDVQELMLMWGPDSADNDNNGQNPLLIDVVVAHVMQYLPISTLLKCRLVNQLWYHEATYVLKQRQTFTINRDNVGKLPKIFDLESPSTNPFSGNFLFRIVRFEVGFLVKSYREILEQFFKKYGSEIHNFSIHCEEENSSILYTEEVRNIFLPYLKNVKVLELSVPTKITERQTMYDDIRPKVFIYDKLTTLKLRQMDTSLDIGGYSVSITKELLKLGPYLRSLGVETHTKEVVTRILQALNDKECKNITNQLTELYLDAFITEEHLMLLLPLDFKLKTLQLSYCTVNVSSAMLEALLCKQRTTLQTLILGDYQKRTTFNSLPLIVKLPIMSELRHLKFVDPLFPDHRQIMLNPLNYSEQLPCLTELSFEHETGKPTGPHYFQDVFVCPPSCQTLQTLRISHGLTEPQLVPAAVKMFPNLKRLELANAPDVVIQAVWKECTTIKVLYLVLSPSNLNIDSLMTGIPDQVCRRIQEKNLFSQVDMMNALDIIRTEAAICNLSELETLRIDGYASSLITAVTGYLAFSHMENLTSISIKADIITLSRECRRVLGEKLHLSQFEMF